MNKELRNKKIKEEFDLVKYLLPDVINSKLETAKFDPEAIINSLLLETDASKEEALSITLDVIRKIIGADLKILTAPLIRELVNSAFLTKGYELYRYQYTRLGFPFFDFGKIFEKGKISEKEVFLHLKTEYKEVQKLIDKIKNREFNKEE